MPRVSNAAGSGTESAPFLSARRAGAWTVALVAALMLVLVAIARRAEDVAGSGDIAVIESYTFDVLHGQLLVGPYSRFEWHHPGPLYMYVLAPFYALSGSRASGLAAGALTVNLLSFATIGWVSLRIASPTLGILLGSAATLFIVRTHAILASAWNAHAIVLPMLASIALAAAIGAGRLNLLPLLVAFISLTAQTHVGVVPVASALCCAAVAMAAMRLSRLHDVAAWRHFRRVLIVSASLGALLWAAPIVEQLTHEPGNLTQLWRFFRSDQPRLPFFAAAAVWTDQMSGWLRPSFTIALGLPARSTPSIPVALLAMLAVLSMMPLARIAARAGREFSASLAVTALVCAGTALWSTTRITGGVFDHQVFWMSCIGPLVLVVVVNAVVDAWRSGSASILWPARTVLLGGFSILVLGHGYAELKQIVDRSYRPFPPELAAQTIADETEKFARQRGGRILITFDQPAWEVAAGAIVQLQKRGVPIAVESAATWMFTDVLAPTGAETEAVAVSREGRHLELLRQAGVTTIAARRGYFADVVPLRAGRNVSPPIP